MIESNWGGPVYPNATTKTDPIDNYSFVCPSQGCLYNIVDDIEERHEVSAQYPDVVERLKKEMAIAEQSIWSANHRVDPACDKAAHDIYGGFYGPWKEI